MVGGYQRCCCSCGGGLLLPLATERPVGGEKATKGRRVANSGSLRLFLQLSPIGLVRSGRKIFFANENAREEAKIFPAGSRLPAGTGTMERNTRGDSFISFLLRAHHRHIKNNKNPKTCLKLAQHRVHYLFLHCNECEERDQRGRRSEAARGSARS